LDYTTSTGDAAGIETSVETRLAQLEALLANRSEEGIDHSIETRLGSLEIKLSTVTAATTVVTKELFRYTREFYQVRINSVRGAATC